MPIVPNKDQLKKQKSWGQSQSCCTLLHGLAEKNLHLDVWPSKTHFSGMQKLVLREISLTNHLLINLAGITDQ